MPPSASATAARHKFDAAVIAAELIGGREADAGMVKVWLFSPTYSNSTRADQLPANAHSAPTPATQPHSLPVSQSVKVEPAQRL